MARIEAAGVADHGDEPGFSLHRGDRLGVLQAVGERNFDLHMLAGLEALKRLLGVHLRRGGEDDRVESRNFQALGEIGRDVADAVLRRRLFGLVEIAPDERDRLDPVDQLDRVEMLEAEGAGAGQRDFDGLGHGRTPEGLRSTRTVIASGAKQSRGRRTPYALLDCFVADAPRNDGAGAIRRRSPE